MKTNTKFDTITDIININKGYITRKDINKHNIPSMFLSLYVKRNKLIKCGSGFYARKEWIIDDYLILQYKYPKLIYSFYSAAYLHKLGDYIPSDIEVTAPKNYRPFSLPKKGVVLHTDTRDSTYNLGIIEIKNTFGNIIKVYDLEKTVCDFIRNRNKIDPESFIKCINYYKNRKDKNRYNLMRYAKIMKIEDKVYNLMEVILNED